MNEQLFKEALAYAEDPATDKTFMAFKMLELLLKQSGDKYFPEDLLKGLVKKAFAMADEFVSLSNPASANEEK